MLIIDRYKLNNISINIDRYNMDIIFDKFWNASCNTQIQIRTLPVEVKF